MPADWLVNDVKRTGVANEGLRRYTTGGIGSDGIESFFSFSNWRITSASIRNTFWDIREGVALDGDVRGDWQVFECLRGIAEWYSRKRKTVRA